MKGKKRIPPILVSSVLAAGMLLGSGISVQAELNLGELGSENNQIAAPATGAVASSEIIALDDLGISIVPGSYISIEQLEGFVYIYTQESGTIPYVIVGCYNVAAEDFTDQFTQYMGQEYSDLQVTSQESMITLKDREFSSIQYSYNVGGYVIQDTRLFLAENGNTYMFGAKEIPDLSYYVGSTLEETAGSFAYLAGGDSDYAKHVDSTRAVTSDAAVSDPVGDIESTVSDVLQQSGAGNNQSSGGTVGNIGGVSSSVEDGQTDIGNTDSFSMGSITFSQENVSFTGTWVPFEDGFKLYLPNDWYVYDLSEEQTQQGVLFAAGDTSGIENPPGISVVWAYSDGVQSLEELAADLTQGGYQVDDLVSINGIPCVSYRVEENDCSAIMFFHPTNKQYLFCVTGTGYASNTDMICHILTSLSLT